MEKSDSDLPILKGKKLQEFEIYKKFLKDLEEDFDEIKIDKFIQEKIEPNISKFKNFIEKIYAIFIKKAIEKRVVTDNIFPNNNIIFNEKNLEVEAFFKTSE